jgi:DNA processing protein
VQRAMNSLGHQVLTNPPILPEREMGACEALWVQMKASFETIAELFRNHPSSLPSQLVSGDKIEEAISHVRGMIEGARIGDFGVRVRGSIEYPERLAAPTLSGLARENGMRYV